MIKWTLYLKQSMLVASMLLPVLLLGQKLKSLKIGDTLPAIVFRNTSSGKTIEIRKADEKATLIDFWATWCSPCVSTLPKIDSIQKKYTRLLDIVLVTREEKATVVKLLNHMSKRIGNSNLSSIVEDTMVSNLFPHKVLPHYVWINQRGIITAITDGSALTDENIESLLNNSDIKLPVKKDQFLELDAEKPTFTSIGSERKDDFIFQSTFLRYIQDVYTMSTRKPNFTRCTNHSILLLYKIALGEFNLSFINNNRVILEGFTTEDDSLMIGRSTYRNKKKWERIRFQHLYNYEIYYNNSIVSSKMSFDLMRKDLNAFFANLGISGKLEYRKQKVFVLVRTSEIDKLKSEGGPTFEKHTLYSLKMRNVPISAFVSKLQSSYYDPDSAPILDETNYSGRIDIEVNAELNKIFAINKELERYNLRFEERERLIPMIVLTKSKPHTE